MLCSFSPNVYAMETNLPTFSWISLFFSESTLTLFMNGASGGNVKDGEITNAPDISWDATYTLYIARDGSNYFQGKIDEVSLFY